MSSVPDVTCRTRSKRLPWFFVGAGAAGLVLVVARLAMTGGVPDVWVLAGVVLLPLGVGGAYAAAVRVHADADGLSYRTLLRRRRARWEDVADVRVYVQHLRHGDMHRVEVVTRGGRAWRLPLPVGPSSEGQAGFDDTVEALRALHRRHGTPERFRHPHRPGPRRARRHTPPGPGPVRGTPDPGAATHRHIGPPSTRR
ncbi:PH domain-containing protein [Streptomyces cellulosae]